MNAAQQREAAKEFAEYWSSRGYEKGDAQPFWLALLRDVFGVDQPEKMIFFEGQVKVDKLNSSTQARQTNFIDARIPKTKVLIEQKSSDKDPTEPEKQSDGTSLTPFQQGKKYAAELPFSQRPRWIVVCTFREFRVHAMEQPDAEPVVVKLEDLPKEYHLLNFLVKDQDKALDHETAISITAGEIVGRIYDAFLKEYNDPDSLASQRSLNILCVRLVFCLYAEDAGVFDRNQFHDYLTDFAVDPRDALIKLFKVLDQKPEERSPYLDDRLNAFPYVNGGLFKDEDVEIPKIPLKLLTLILRDASEKFDWSGINPTIFGAVFESTLNPETRRQGGMHYTSVENIHKVIDPLFLDELHEEFEKIRALKQPNVRKGRLVEFQEKLGSLTFFDPACGSGNFLTETYLSLRRLENDALRLIYDGGRLFSANEKGAVVKVSLDQFYGIEINDFAVSVAKTALWIAESQMLQETAGILSCQLDFLPLTNYDQIVEANALSIDWNNVVDKNKLNYIMGNPPFVGRRYRTPEQQREVSLYFDYKDVDYVACWFLKAADFIKDRPIKVAFVATNSITQGEQVAAIWKRLISEYGVEIFFAYKTFRWDSEASLKAHVHCVIIGFASGSVNRVKKIFYTNRSLTASNINPYLLDAPNVFINIRTKPICDVPEMKNGNVPLDGDALKIEEEDYLLFKDFPYVKRLYGGRELLHNEKRYVLWLVGVSPATINLYPEVKKRVVLCRENRLKMKDKGTQKLADYPTTFRDTNNPDNFIALPMVSSEKREYLPTAYLHGDSIATNQIQTIPNATLYHFGVLSSRVHMAWLRTVCGRLKSDYRYSKDVVYNNFPWPMIGEEEQEKIAATAREILNARAVYPDSSLADMYDAANMHSELRKAHQANDKAVMKAYGFAPETPESEIVAKLMERYEALVGKN